VRGDIGSNGLVSRYNQQGCSIDLHAKEDDFHVD